MLLDGVLSLTDYFEFLVGVAPTGFEFLPYIFTCIFLYMVCRFIFEFFVYIFGLLVSMNKNL